MQSNLCHPRTRKRACIVSLAATTAATWLVVLPAASVTAQSAASPITRPVISENVSPLEPIVPVARDGHRGVAFLRKPPGTGPFPAVVVIHGGLVTAPTERLKDIALSLPQTSRFLAAGYVVVAITYRSRDADPQSTLSLADSLAAIEHVRQLPYVDPKSIVVFGCSGGGDLAVEVAAATAVAGIASEEPASVLLTGILNKETPKSGERHTPRDAEPLLADPQRYYTAQFQRLTREKIARIRSPILIQQGDENSPLNRFNAQVLIPELRAAGKPLEVICNTVWMLDGAVR